MGVVWWGFLGRLEPLLGADSPAVLQVSAFLRPWCCPSVLCGPRTLPPRSRRRSPAGLLSWPCGAERVFAAPWGPGRKRQWAGAGLSSRSGLCGPAQSPHAGGTLPAVPPGTGSAARPGEVRGSCRHGSGGQRRRAPAAPHGALVLLVPPGFSWNPSAQREKFGPGLVHSSSAFNARLILNEGKCMELTSYMYDKFAVE